MSPNMFDAIKEAEQERLRSRDRLRAALRALDRRGCLEGALARLRAETALRRSDDALRALHAEAARLLHAHALEAHGDGCHGTPFDGDASGEGGFGEEGFGGDAFEAQEDTSGHDDAAPAASETALGRMPTP